MFSKMNIAAAALALVSFTSAAEMTVMVGGSMGNVFNPSSTTAAVGDTVKFVFESSMHSVAQGSFDAPCTSGTTMDPFYSGIMQGDGSKSFVIKIANTDPIYYYCSFADHCSGSGMVGGINVPTTGNTIDAYRTAANAFSGNAVSPAAINSVVAGEMASSATTASTMAMDASSTMAMSTSASMDMSMTMTMSSQMMTSVPTTTGTSASPTATAVGAGLASRPVWGEAIGVSILVGVMAAFML